MKFKWIASHRIASDWISRTINFSLWNEISLNHLLQRQWLNVAIFYHVFSAMYGVYFRALFLLIHVFCGDFVFVSVFVSYFFSLYVNVWRFHFLLDLVCTHRAITATATAPTTSCTVCTTSKEKVDHKYTFLVSMANIKHTFSWIYAIWLWLCGFRLVSGNSCSHCLQVLIIHFIVTETKLSQYYFFVFFIQFWLIFFSIFCMKKPRGQCV